MPLTQASLATKIQAEVIGLYGAPDSASILADFANAIAAAVVDEIQTNAVVTTTVPGVRGGPSTVSGTGTVQ